jgi:hypothetical protein
LAAFALLLAALDRGYRSYAQHHFIAPLKFQAALRAGQSCLVFSGGSDMQSALDLATVEALWGKGTRPCMADLTIGGTFPDVRFMAFRRYLAEGRRPSAIVIGFKGHEIVDRLELKPGYYLGSNAFAYEWGKFSDLTEYYPRPSFAALDNGLRFLLFRTTAIGAHRQALWQKLERFERHVGILPPLDENAFGNAQAFAELAAEQRAQALAARRHDAAPYELELWPALLVDLAKRAGVNAISFVRLPTVAASERAYFPDPAVEDRFDRFVEELARAHGGQFINLSHEPWVNDSLLIDGLHYTEHGQALISRAVAERLSGSGSR